MIPKLLSYSSIFITLFAALLLTALAGAGCRSSLDKKSVAPRSLRDVPAQRLAYTFQPDVPTPAGVKEGQATERLEAIQKDFDERRRDEALVRTVTSPDGQRALALYETGESQPGEFHIDLYATSGNFLRNITPPDMVGVFPAIVSWSPDGNHFSFVARKSLTPQPTPLPPDIVPEGPPSSPDPAATVAPVFTPVPVYNTEQIYIANRDGFDLKPLTSRDGLIYFYIAWAPDNHGLAALACTESEWSARPAELPLPAGRPRLVNLDARERLLDDRLTDVLPVWSPDASKVATAFDTDVAIYDAAADTPTSANIPLRDALIAASREYDEKNLKKPSAANNSSSKEQPSALPVSFNPVIRLEWELPETLYLQTGFLRMYGSEPVSNYLRWHKLSLSVQAALLSQGRAPVSLRD